MVATGEIKEKALKIYTTAIQKHVVNKVATYIKKLGKWTRISPKWNRRYLSTKEKLYKKQDKKWVEYK